MSKGAWTVEVWRYKAMHEVDFDTVEEAVAFISNREDCFIERLLAPDGRVAWRHPFYGGNEDEYDPTLPGIEARLGQLGLFPEADLSDPKPSEGE